MTTGKVIPVTVVEAGPCTVVQKKTVENDGYEAVQLGYQPRRRAQAQQARAGPPRTRLACEPMKVLKEFTPERLLPLSMWATSSRPTSSLRASTLTCTGISKGKGYAGRYQALRRPAHPHDPRRRPCSPSRRFYGFHFHPSAVSSRARSAPARWAASRSPSRTWTSSKVDAEHQPDRRPGRHPRPQGRRGVSCAALPRSCPRRRATAPASATTRRRLLPASIRRRLPPEITKERRVS